MDCAKVLKTEMTNRFSKYLNPADNNFDPLFVSATFLDPSATLMLDASQQRAAEDLLLKKHTNIDRVRPS